MPDSGCGVLVRLESRTRRVLAAALTLAVTASAAMVIVGPVLAEVLAGRGATLAELGHALNWDPENPHLHLRLGHAALASLEGGDLEAARRHLEAALRRRPAHALTWLALAFLADREGDRARAREALQTAVRLDRRNVALRWEAALLALRWGERDGAVAHLGYVAAVDGTRREAAFQLARLLLGPGESLARLFPAEAEPLAALLEFALRERDLPLARLAWGRRSALLPAMPEGLRRRYLELLLDAGDPAGARRLWTALVPDAHPAAAENAVWNGSFEAPALLGWGFDWQAQRVRGVEVKLDRSVAAHGRQSLRLAFDSVPRPDFAGVWQNVAVEPGRDYQLRALAKASGLTGRPGVTLQVVAAGEERILAETDAIAGTTAGWVALETRVPIPPGTRLVQVRLRRGPAAGPDGPPGGQVWIDDVRLIPREGAGA